MREIDEFLFEEQKCEKSIYHKFKPKIDLAEDLIDTYINLFSKTTDLGKRQELDTLAILIINAKMIKSLNCALEILKRGYYIECNSILRDAYETHFLSKYLMKYPQEAEKWLFENRKIPNSEIRKKLHVSDEFK